MNTDPINQQTTIERQASACPAPPQPLTPGSSGVSPADTALVPQSHVAGMPLPERSFDSAIHPVIHSSSYPSHTKKPRNGKIARLPKPVRELVNRMLFNHLPQEKIVGALEEIGINVTQRNISNWKTHGGYREWRMAQEYAIQLHLHQDNLMDLVRRHDANELPEVGLQAAATQLSQFFLTPEARQLLVSNPKEYERRVSMLTRISAQLKAHQKYRDDCAKGLGYNDDPARIRRNTTGELEKLRQDWSSKPGHSAKDSATVHRNELPKHGELLHLMPPKPQPLFPPFEEFMEALRKRDPAAKPQLTDGAPAGPAATPPAPASSPASTAFVDDSPAP